MIQHQKLTSLIIIGICLVLALALRMSTEASQNSEDMKDGFRDLKSVIMKQDSTIRQQSSLIEGQTQRISELEVTVKELKKSNETYKYQLDSTRSVLNYVLDNYEPRSYERISPGGG